MSAETHAGETYEEWRSRLATMHDEGARDAMVGVMGRDNVPVVCGDYCYGGSADPDFEEILADLAEAGWRLVREGAVDGGQ